ncbi:MAG: 2-dehydropantoate 2-reductase [Candidatus Omnitrophica bacterium]|nr:2-dehydropantoate 2-reductase [Candidatus Omnitrophota bacterium]
MRIAVLGCGAIGGLFLGHLARIAKNIVGVVREEQQKALKEEGLFIESNGQNERIKVNVETKLTEPVDLAIFATKTNDLENIVKPNLDYLKDATVVSTQNGVRAESILNNFFPAEKIITTIVMFGATFYPPNKVVCNFPGNLILGSVFGQEVKEFTKVKEILNKVFDLEVIANIKGAKYLKLFINLNNCIPAIIGKPMQQVFKNLEIAKLAIKLNKEAYQVVGRSGINLESLPNYPKQRIEGLVSMPPDDAAQLFSKIMTGLSKEPLYGSILQSIKRGKLSEIDYINGAIVQLAKNNNQKASLNEEIVKLVHEVERTGFLSESELLSRIKGVADEK